MIYRYYFNDPYCINISITEKNILQRKIELLQIVKEKNHNIKENMLVSIYYHVQESLRFLLYV